jgi:c-di-GMP-related signal transduction protein
MGYANPSSYFTVGLLSALDVIFQVNMEQALESISLASDQRSALLDRSGPLGAALGSVLALEQGDDGGLQFGDLTPANISRWYFSAVDWVNELGNQTAPKSREHLRNQPRIRRNAGRR